MLHRIKAGDEYSIHSPFLFDLYTQTIAYHKNFYQFDELNALRLELLKDKTLIELCDLGAGSKRYKAPKREVKNIIKSSAKPEYIAKFLFKLINYTQPKVMLELGTSLGLTSLYMAAPYKTNTLYTIEGSPQTYDFATKLFKRINAVNIVPILGNIDEVLPIVISKLATIDFVFFDANHTYDATMAYYKICLEKVGDHSVFVFDDIYWSQGMKRAWDDICKDDRVRLSLDFFHLGLVFFRKNQPKQHFYLKIQ